MNKKIYRNIFLVTLVILLGLTVVDFGQNKRTFEEEISFFIIENLEGEVKYTPQGFSEVNEAFLLSKSEIYDPFLIMQDSIQNQLGLLGQIYLSNTLTELVNNAKIESANLRLKTITNYLKLDAKLKRILKDEEIAYKRIQDLLYEEEVKMHSAINDLNTALSTYNLSVFNLNLDQSETVIYLHNFLLSDPINGSYNQQSVFELNRLTKKIVSFKEI